MRENNIEILDERIGLCMLADRYHLQQTLIGLERAIKNGRRIGQRYARLVSDIDESIARRQTRVSQLPAVIYPQELPVVARREYIAQMILHNQVIVLCGETGSGKTTQVPKICLELGRGIDGLIGHTQPRRIAARSVAHRIAQELKTPLEKAVGYKIRFSDRTTPDCYLKLMTDGILLAETQSDHLLSRYDTIIIDEAHERSLNIDFLLGYLKNLLPQRPDLKLIIMSATIDPQRFSKHFNDAPTIEVSGRVFPVETIYQPLEGEDIDEKDLSLQDSILKAVDEVTLMGTGDILIFLSGEREIRETAEELRKHHPVGTEILPLYSRLSTAEQDKVFKPHDGMRIILATNVAETSLTVPGIRYVIDPGYARISRFSTHNKVQRLPIEAISKASADQRKGRCGRVESGVCVRLYSEQDYIQRPEFTDPEIVRTNLAGVILQMTALGLGDVAGFPFMDPPNTHAIRTGYQTLHEIGAIEHKNVAKQGGVGKLTEIGHKLARLPVDPRLGRMLLAADTEDCLPEILVIASALSIPDPRRRPLDEAERADEVQAKFVHEDSDFLSYVNLWNFYHEQAKHLSNTKLRKLCKEHFLSYLRMREWHDVYQQLRILLTEMGYKITPGKIAEYEAVHRALITGLLSNIGVRTGNFEYTGAWGTRFSIFPGSGQFHNKPKWIVCSELVRTTKLYARKVAKIQPEWAENAASHVVNRSYFEPHWQRRSAHVGAFEKLSLYGLEIVSKRRVHYGPINPREAREIFIRHALVLGDYKTAAPFAEHNKKLLEEAAQLEAKTRRRDLLADESAIYAFYNKRVPDGIYNGPLLEEFLKKTSRLKPRRMFMSLEDLLGNDVKLIKSSDYPDELVTGDNDNSSGRGSAGNRVPLVYSMNPGKPDDGVTAIVPVTLLAALNQTQLDWLIPGWLTEKIIVLIKHLPKNIRTSFLPAGRYARMCANSMITAASENGGQEIKNKPFYDVLSEHLYKVSGVRVENAAWRHQELPTYLQMNIKVVDGQGTELATGRDLLKLKTKLKGQLGSVFTQLPESEFNRSNITNWDFGEALPQTVEVKVNNILVQGYPALVDQVNSVSLQLFPSRELQHQHMRGGMRRLIMLELGGPLQNQGRTLPGFTEMALFYASLGQSSELRYELLEFIADRIMMISCHNNPDVNNNINHEEYLCEVNICSKSAYEKCLNEGNRSLHIITGEVCSLMSKILKAYHEVDDRLSQHIPEAWVDAVDDIEKQLAYLFCKRFMVNIPYGWLQHYPRYMNAIIKRIEKLGGGGMARDLKYRQEINPPWEAYLRRLKKHQEAGIYDPALEYYRWMLEEMRVSTFAQELGTAMPVSFKRLSKQWELVRK